MSLARAVDLRADDLAGKTWAGYIRESTRGQADRYGPEIQRSEQAKFGERHGLVATNREYVDLVSGKDTLRRTDFARMLADAEAGAFEVLLCYDTSRFARNVADAWAYRDRLARAGVILVFCADGLIAGNVETYELEGLKTVADAAYIRRLSRNVARGYEQKWRLYCDPGGHAPLGFERVGERQLLEPVEGPVLDLVRLAYRMYATGVWSDVELADQLGMTEPGLTETLTNPLYAGRAIRHKGKPDQEEKPARFAAPVDPELFERVQAIRESRRTAHSAGGGSYGRRPYPLVRLMHCVECGSGYYGDANNDRRRVRHSMRPVCGPSATYRAEVFEEQIGLLFDESVLDDSDIEQVLAAMRASYGTQADPAPEPANPAALRAELQARLGRGEITIEAFSRAWRVLDGPLGPTRIVPPDEQKLRDARESLTEFKTLWRDPAVPDKLREEAVAEIIQRLDIRGREIVGIQPQPNENAWLLGYAALKVGMLVSREEYEAEGRLKPGPAPIHTPRVERYRARRSAKLPPRKKEVGMVGARGVNPHRPT